MRKVVVLLVFCSILFLISGCSVKKMEKLTDAEKFANEYSISENNLFHYIDVDGILDLFHNQSGIVFLGNSDSEWSVIGAEILNRVAKEKNIDKVYYFNPENIKYKKDKKYNEVIKLFDINEDTSLPVVYVICNGKILDQEGYLVHADSVINQETIEQLENKYLDLISQCM